MTREQAESEVQRLSREHPERATHRWMARENPDGSWSVARVALPGGLRVQKLTPTVESRPRPPQADDPRSAQQRDVPFPGT
jgi:hypothetical protein